MSFKSKIGTIKIQRPYGIEIWNITSGNFSIDKPTDRYRMNFWVESADDLIQKLEDTGELPITFEIKIPFIEQPNFDEPWKYKHPDFKTIEDDYGDDEKSGFWNNFYYYSHEPFENIEMEIIKNKVKHQIKVTGELSDPIDWRYGKAKYTISANMKLNDSFNSFWMN